MSDIVDIDEFRKRKLAKAEAEWLEYLQRAGEFIDDGKNKFADEMMAKAKEARKVIDKLRGPVVKSSPTPFLKDKAPEVGISFSFSADMGYPKVSPPSPTPTPTK